MTNRKKTITIKDVHFNIHNDNSIRAYIYYNTDRQIKNSDRQIMVNFWVESLFNNSLRELISMGFCESNKEIKIVNQEKIFKKFYDNLKTKIKIFQD